MHFRTALHSAIVIFAFTVQALADPLPVQHVQGAVHGYLTIHNQGGALIGYGEFVQFVTGERVTERTTLHFRDGSLDDETAVFTQNRVFRFISDHHIQRGPFFKQSIESTIDSNGQVTIHTTAANGKVTEDTSHIDLPNDLANGILGTCLENISHTSAGTTLGMLVPMMGKGRLIKLNVTPDGSASFSAVAGATRTADIFRIKLDLGGLVGVIAPILGKKPADIIVWVVEGDAPVIVREDAQLADGVPVVSIQLAGTSFSRVPAINPKK